MGVRSAELAAVIVTHGTKEVLKHHPKMSDLATQSNLILILPRHLCVHWEGRVHFHSEK